MFMFLPLSFCPPVSSEKEEGDRTREAERSLSLIGHSRTYKTHSSQVLCGSVRKGIPDMQTAKANSAWNRPFPVRVLDSLLSPQNDLLFHPISGLASQHILPKLPESVNPFGEWGFRSTSPSAIR